MLFINFILTGLILVAIRLFCINVLTILVLPIFIESRNYKSLFFVILLITELFFVMVEMDFFSRIQLDIIGFYEHFVGYLV